MDRRETRHDERARRTLTRELGLQSRRAIRSRVEELLDQSRQDQAPSPIEVDTVHVELPPIPGSDLIAGLVQDERAKRVAIDGQEPELGEGLSRGGSDQ